MYLTSVLSTMTSLLRYSFQFLFQDVLQTQLWPFPLSVKSGMLAIKTLKQDYCFIIYSEIGTKKSKSALPATACHMASAKVVLQHR